MLLLNMYLMHERDDLNSKTCSYFEIKMEKYQILKFVGDGTYGTVNQAINRSTGEVVAIKRMKEQFPTWESCLALREIKSLRKLSHNNIISLKEVIRDGNDLSFVFDFMD